MLIPYLLPKPVNREMKGKKSISYRYIWSTSAGIQSSIARFFPLPRWSRSRGFVFGFWRNISLWSHALRRWGRDRTKSISFIFTKNHILTVITCRHNIGKKDANKPFGIAKKCFPKIALQHGVRLMDWALYSINAHLFRPLHDIRIEIDERLTTAYETRDSVFVALFWFLSFCVLIAALHLGYQNLHSSQ